MAALEIKAMVDLYDPESIRECGKSLSDIAALVGLANERSLVVDPTTNAVAAPNHGFVWTIEASTEESLSYLEAAQAAGLPTREYITLLTYGDEEDGTFDAVAALVMDIF